MKTPGYILFCHSCIQRLSNVGTLVGRVGLFLSMLAIDLSDFSSVYLAAPSVLSPFISLFEIAKLSIGATILVISFSHLFRVI